MSLVPRTGRVFAHGQPTDMRKSFDTLAAIVRLEMKHDILEGDLFVFVGRDARRAKVLYWDGTGTCLLAKRLEKGRFAAPWKSAALAKRVSWTSTELALFLEGSELLLRGPVSPPPWKPGELRRKGQREEKIGPLEFLAASTVQPAVLDIDGEKDIEVLRDAMKRLLAENERLTATILALTKQLMTARGKDKAALEQRLAETKAKLERAQKELFGPKSERREGEKREDDEPPKTKPKGHGRTPQPGLLTRDVTHDVDEPDKICTQCGSPLTEWLKEQELSEEIDLIQQQFILLRHLRKKWSCSCGGCVETAIGPEKLFPGARYSINVAVDIAVKKYLDHMPLERLVRAWSRDGLVVTSQTLWDYLDKVAHFVKPVYDRLHAYVFSQPVIGADETRWRMLATRGAKGSSKTWWVWALTSPQAVVYHLDATRSKSVAEKLLKDFQGIVVCDGYGAYQSLRAAHDTVVLAHCWAHVRREFLEIESAFPVEVAEITALIQQLYLAEQDVPRGAAGDAKRHDVRATSSTATIAKIFGWVVKTLPKQTPGNGLAHAIRYMAGVWSGLVLFLDNPAVPLDNNASERSMRGPVVGRKNHYGSRSQRGTEVAAVLYTILESCKLAGVNPSAYLSEAVHAGIRERVIALPHEWAPRPPDDAPSPTAANCSDDDRQQ